MSSDPSPLRYKPVAVIKGVIAYFESLWPKLPHQGEMTGPPALTAEVHRPRYIIWIILDIKSKLL